MCNCGDENCDCTIDLVDEVENFLNKVDSGDAECPNCKNKMELKNNFKNKGGLFSPPYFFCVYNYDNIILLKESTNGSNDK